MKNLFRSPLFLAGLSVKIVCLFFFGSYYLKDLFIPFLDTAVRHPLSNPWTLAPAQFFPYGSALYVILFVPRWLGYHVLGDLALGTGPLGLALVKGPLLLLDVLLLVLLSTLAKSRSRQLLGYYWLNPILFYITYIHGQLDIASTTFCVFSIVLLIRGRFAMSGLLMAIATLSKFHVVAIIPFMLAFVWNRHFAVSAVRKIGAWSSTWAGVTALGFIPLVYADRFLYASTSSPQAQRLFAAQVNYGRDHTLYLGIVIVLVTLGRLSLATWISDMGLFFGSGAIFGALLLATDPGPGWFFWVFPFLSLFFSTYVATGRSLFQIVSVAYMLYFWLVQSWLQPANPLIESFAFTVLMTALAGTIVALWVLVLKDEVPLQRAFTPTLIGLAGDSGAGKDHLSAVLCDLFNPMTSQVIEGDDYHKWERGDQAWAKYTHLNPRANHLASMADHTQSLSRGITVFQSHYDHAAGRFTERREIKPAKMVIVQGLHAFYLRDMRKSYDLKIYLAPDPLVLLSQKIKRDVQGRGHSMDDVLESMEQRGTDAKLHIEPQKELADWIIEFFPVGELTRQQVIAGQQPELAVRYQVWNDAPISNLLDALVALPDCAVKVTISGTDFNRLIVEVHANLAREDVAGIARRVFPSLRFITRGRVPPVWRGGYDGINQLMAVALLGGVTAGGHA